MLVEDTESALLTMAAYIDLNPVRAGLAENPEDYRWCGYAEATSGSKKAAQRAREGLGMILSESLQDQEFRSDWRRTQKRYRVLLFGEGQVVAADPDRGERGRRGFAPEKIEAVMESGGKVPVSEILRRRVRYFCDGAVLGTAEYVNEVFAREQEQRNRFGH